ncbi:hypothetical protein J3458_022069 [Metarhizium acridum]|uniref:uncharacterized protein n=1 Tax=Metarhizium acridum TaxID=92637 RepID=UPI001C6C71DF|nr:hypothetical protein J3458_022069 [Metarhizium acridum]
MVLFDPSPLITLTIDIITLHGLLAERVWVFKRFWALIHLYGVVSGFTVGLCGSSNVWSVEAKVIGDLDEKQALDFRKSLQGECSMIAVAGALVAQIAITSLSLTDLSQTHWVARALFVFSLISSLSSVSCAATQHMVMAPLVTGDDIRAWIRGGSTTSFPLTLRSYSSRVKVIRPCKPEELDLESLDRQSQVSFDFSLMRQCFTPGVIPVIAMSGPVFLLAMSVLSAVIAFGVYFGFIWTRNLDVNAGLHDSRNVFIVYIVTLGLCTLVSLSQPIQDEERGSEYETVKKYAQQFMENHRDMNWRRPGLPDGDRV